MPAALRLSTDEPILPRQILVESPTRETFTNDKKEDEEKRDQLPMLDALSQQFNMLVVISTFMAGLVISFLSLAYSVIRQSRSFEVGMFFSFLSMIFHFGVILIAARGAALIAQKVVDPEANGSKVDAAFFGRFLVICEQLQFMGTGFFLISMAILMFFLFPSIQYPIMLLVASFVASVIVFWSVYWEISVTFRNLRLLVGLGKKGVEVVRSRGNTRATMTSTKEKTLVSESDGGGTAAGDKMNEKKEGTPKTDTI